MRSSKHQSKAEAAEKTRRVDAALARQKQERAREEKQAANAEHNAKVAAQEEEYRKHLAKISSGKPDDEMQNAHNGHTR